MTFKDTGLTEKVLAAVEAAGYTEPTPIQAKAIPQALAGRDILGIAQTGTGKTAAFTLPMLSRLESGRARARMPRTLILEPTRELAAQVEESFIKYGVNHKLNVALLIGGVSFGDQETKIMRGADVLIATPGRLLDFHERGKLLLTGIEILVIDEADRMLDMGFIPDIEKICKLVPFTRQTLFFSATMPPEITRLTEQFLQNPVRIEVARVGTTAENITQGLVASHGGGAKRETLRQLLRNADNFKNAIIFANRKRDVAILHKSLTKHGFSTGALHGDMDQPARMASLDAFKRGDVSLLVCSDVAARGLDIPDVSHVFNFDVPMHADDYVHRIGRTGRAGKSGTAISIVTNADEKYIDDIRKLIKIDLNWMGPKLNELGDAPIDEERPRRGRERSGSRSRGEGGRGEGRDRRRGGERSERPARAHAPTEPIAQTDAVEAVGGAPAEAAPRRQREDGRRNSRGGERGPRREQPAREERAAPQEKRAQERHTQERHERPAQDRSERRPRRDDDLGPSFVGLGDHVPSFLLRPVRRPARPQAQAQAATAEE
ncbi:MULTISPECIES: DEAD/DEAH box helicase [unclassified Beijerinckia]|uniref:DEAD/DEAH box helicase n=1 Tax=unclassified Beijerinckia TaxID=2638183 RepID=UPI0008972464|nr:MULTISPECIES: DEAD/DEAH box helicase [unclassified Beijerinckia]MDH7795768.1 superfamily II DNA/RNA helicase [Beijerinckia sp. GAS462]SEC15415.1 Superfamily II DNA and RNA helicase [Beijerinckia sp. 28-YEA-48]